MPDSVLKIKSIPFYNSDIVINNPIVDFYSQSATVEIRVNTNNISTPDRLAIDRWHTNIFSPTFKSIINHADAEIIEYDEYAKDIKSTVNASVFPTYVDCNTIIFNARLFNFKRVESSSKLDNISWNEYFSNLAVLTSLRSKDTTKVGAVLVSPENKVLSLGYNGYVKGVDESIFPKNREAENLSDTKYPYVIHAEANCILNLSTLNNLNGSTIYCTLFPCCDCAKLLANAGISKVIYISDKYHNEQQYIASRKIFDASNIKYLQYDGNIYVNKT
jgi:dCMP deaminase